MRRPLLTVIVGLILSSTYFFGAVLANSAAAAHAQPITPHRTATSYYIGHGCYNTGSGYCLNNSGDRNAQGNPIIEWPYSTNGDEGWYADFQGYVSSSACWPFTCGIGLNNLYNGYPVYQFRNLNYDLCQGAPPENGNYYYRVYTEACGGGSWAEGTDWVGYGYEVVNVLASNFVGGSECLTGWGHQGWNQVNTTCSGNSYQLWAQIK